MELEEIKVFWYRIENEKTINELKLKFNADNITRNNNEIDLYKGEWVKIEVNNFIYHIVKPAETILEIATKYAITKEQLIENNKLVNEKLFIGQRLKIFRN